MSEVPRFNQPTDASAPGQPQESVRVNQDVPTGNTVPGSVFADTPVLLLDREYRPKVPSEERPEQQKQRDASLTAVLAQSADAGLPVMMGWIKLDRDGPHKHFRIGDVFADSPEARTDTESLEKTAQDQSKEITTNSPVGGRAFAHDAETFRGQLDQFTAWRPIHTQLKPRQDHDDGDKVLERKGFSIEEFAKTFRGPYALVVQAHPHTQDQIISQMETLSGRGDEALLISKDSTSAARDVVKFGVAEDEMFDAETWGFWDITVHFGVEDPRDLRVARTIAGLATNDRQYKLIPGGEDEIRNTYGEAVAATRQKPTDPREITDINQCSTAELASWGRTPEKEITGYTIRKIPSSFAKNMKEVPEDRRLVVGYMYDDIKGIVNEMVIDTKDLTSHVFIVGNTRMGKTELVRNLIRQLSAPVIALDPKGGEFQILGAQLQKDNIPVTLNRPGEMNQVSAGYPLLVPEPGYPQIEHDALIVDLLASTIGDDITSSGATDSTTMRYVKVGLLGDMTRNYPSLAEYTYRHPITGEPLLPGGKAPDPKLLDLSKRVSQAIKDQGYVGDARDVEPYVRSRLLEIMQGLGGQYIEGESLDTEKMLSGGVHIIEVDQFENKNDQALAMGITFIRIIERLQVEKRQGIIPPAGKPRAVLVIDEAHTLFHEGPLADQLSDMLAKCGSLGLGIILLDQSTEYVNKRAVDGTATKGILKIQGGEDAKKLGLAAGLDEEQTAYLTDLDRHEIVLATIGNKAVYGITVFDPNLSDDPTQIQGLETIIANPDGRELYTFYERYEATRFLNATEAGRIALGGWAELYTIIKLGNLKGEVNADLVKNPTMQKYIDQLREARQRIEQDADGTVTHDGRRITDCAIEEAVRRSIEGRAHIILQQKDNPLEPKIKQITSKIKASLDGDPIPEDTVSLGLDAYRHLPIRAELIVHLDNKRKAGIPNEEVGRHPHSKRLEEELGQPIPGEGTLEQLGVMQYDKYNTPLGTFLFAPHPWGGNLIDQAIGKSTDDVVAKDIAAEEKAKAAGEPISQAPGEATMAWSNQDFDRVIDLFVLDPSAWRLLKEEYLRQLMQVKNSVLEQRGLL